jgi:beta-ureidopropionase
MIKLSHADAHRTRAPGDTQKFEPSTCRCQKTLMRILFLMVVVTPVGAAYCEDNGPIRSRDRHVRVVTISQHGLRASDASLMDETIERLNRSASFRPDIACLPETVTEREAETLPGPTSARISDWAREHNCYVVFSIKVRSEDRTFNSAVLVDRKGEIVGRYDKIHPTEGEITGGISPGATDPPVFETDFGKIGMQICFDASWPDQWRRLKEQGAEIVFFPSAYPAPRQLRRHAWVNQFYVVSSTKDRASSIYDIAGDEIASSGRFQYWAGAELALDTRIFEIDFHTRKMRDIAAKYGSKVRIVWYHDDDLVSLTSLAPDLTVKSLMVEYGLTPFTAYLERCQQVQDKHRIVVSDGKARPPSGK